MKNKIVTFIAILFLVAVSYGVYSYHKPHTNVVETTPELTITAQELITKFNEDKDAISPKLIDKVLEIEGTITTIEQTNDNIIIILNTGIKCELKNESQQLLEGQNITVKGIYSGFDEMFNEISLIRCYLTT